MIYLYHFYYYLFITFFNLLLFIHFYSMDPIAEAIRTRDANSLKSLLKQNPPILPLYFTSALQSDLSTLEIIVEHFLSISNSSSSLDLPQLASFVTNKILELNGKMKKILLWTCKEGLVEVMRMILHCNLYHFGNNYKNELSFVLEAMKNNHIIILEELLNFGVDINFYNFTTDNLPLVEACKLGNIEFVKLFLKSGADVNIGIEPAIIYAAKLNFFEIVKILVENGAYSGIGRALFGACDNGCAEIVEFLILKLQNFAKINEVVKEKALRHAAVEGNLEIVKILLKYGANINSEYNPLMVAADFGYEDVVEEFLMNSAEVDKIEMRRDEMYTPLRIAVEEGHVEVVKILLKFGARIDKFPFSLLPEADERMTKILLKEKGIDINATGRWGKTPLYAACESGNIKVVKELIRNGARIISDTKSLMAAAMCGNLEIVTILVENGIILTPAGGCNISEMCYQQCYNIVLYLLQCGAEVNYFL